MATTDDLVRFVEAALGRGTPRAEIERTLLEAGWDRARVAAALGAFADVPFPLPVPKPRPSLSARDAFLYLLLFTTLYMSVFNAGVLLFALIDVALPDAVAQPSAGEAARSAARWAISTIVVAFPVFLFLSRMTSREVRRDPAARGSVVRRWLTYLTLFVSSGFLIGDVIALVFSALAGDLTTRFVLKAGVLGALAAAVLAYYLLELRADAAPPAAAGRRPAVFGWGATVAAAVTVAAGLYVIGSPADERARRADNRRVTDLLTVSRSVDTYWTRHAALPASLDALQADAGSGPLPRDPLTARPYEYRTTGEKTYELCATFDRASDRPSELERMRFWRHGAGRQCFDVEATRTEREDPRLVPRPPAPRPGGGA